MRRAKRLIAVVAVLLVAAGISLLMIPPKSTTPQSESAAERIIVRTYDATGELSWEVAAQRGSLEGQEARLEEVEVAFQRDGETLLTAVAAEMLVARSRAELLGGVTASHDGQYELATEALHWTSDAETLVAAATTLTFDRGIVHGNAFSYDPKAERAALVGDVHGAIDLDEPATFRGERALWEGDDRLALESVEVEHGEWTYRAQRAMLSADAETVTFEGDAVVALRSAELRAERVTMDSTGVAASGRVRVTLGEDFFWREDDA
jgi:lipopolysaccharide export system protein LptC